VRRRKEYGGRRLKKEEVEGKEEGCRGKGGRR
jgi:hypothetical protein